MKTLIMIMAAVALTSASAMADVTVNHAGSQPVTTGDTKYFTGKATVESRFQRESPARIGDGIVTFEAGARTAWHTHPLGQTLIVTSGSGWVQEWGKPAQKIRTGDVVWIPPGVKHWHGACATEPMTHIAVAESFEGKTVIWMEKVSDSQYPHE